MNIWVKTETHAFMTSCACTLFTFLLHQHCLKVLRPAVLPPLTALLLPLLLTGWPQRA
jgi:hypothetical protein